MVRKPYDFIGVGPLFVFIGRWPFERSDMLTGYRRRGVPALKRFGFIAEHTRRTDYFNFGVVVVIVVVVVVVGAVVVTVVVVVVVGVVVVVVVAVVVAVLIVVVVVDVITVVVVIVVVGVVVLANYAHVCKEAGAE